LKHAIKVTFVFLFLQSLTLLPSFAQNSDKLEYKAESIEGGNKSYKKLVGNVKFTQTNTIIYCDSTYLYDDKNSMEAFGHVRIEDLEDSVTITSNELYYDGDGRIAKLRGNVVYVDDSLELYTDYLDYDMINKSAVYSNGGKIIDGVNTLESVNGNYDTEGKMMIFTRSVRMISPDYTLESDDLIYNLITKKARTSSPTTITTKNGEILKSEKGSEFDTRNGTYAFSAGEIDTEKYHLKGNELFYNHKLGSYSAKGNVYVLAKEDNIIITGDQANFWKEEGIAKIFGNPLLKRALSNDTLYLRADTLISINDELNENNRLLAYNNVSLFKSDIQGKSDSLVYYLSDSSMAFFDDPILWNEGSQITADTIRVLVENGTIDRLKTSANSFIISKDSTMNFNQIKGRQMTATFNGKNLKNVDVTGNGESIYFVGNENDLSTVMGMNKIVCSNMKIAFVENQVNDIRFYSKPEGNFVPPHELKENAKQLDGFAWRIDERPSRKEILKDPSEVERMRQLTDEMVQEEEEEKTKLEQMMKEKIDIEGIRDQLKKPIKNLPAQ
jgi:lipopolysaccharide export system protein LptA